MIYFFINIMMYLVIILFLIKYFYHNMTIISFIIILFDMNVFLFFIYQNINFLYGILILSVSLILYFFMNLMMHIEKEVILIQNGNINFHEIINNYSYDKLISYLHRHNLKLSDINYCFKRGNKLTIIKKNH